MNDFLTSLRNKPQHIRERIALGTSVGLTLIIAVGWMGALATSGKFALAPVDASETQSASAVVASQGSFSNLLGAASAAFTGASSTVEAVGLSVVDQDASSTLERNAQQEDRTVIPF